MHDLNVRAGLTTAHQLQSFMSQNKGELRARPNGDGSVTLYAKEKFSRPEIWMSDDKKKTRADKQQLARDTIHAVLKNRLGPNVADRAVGGGKGAIRGGDVVAALSNGVKDANNLTPDFKSVLSSPATRASFKDFLAKELSSENLKFHEAVEHLSALAAQGAPDSVLRSHAETIRKEYVADDADQRVNLPGAALKTILDAKFDQMDKNTILEALAPAKTATFNMMAFDSYQRFVREPGR